MVLKKTKPKEIKHAAEYQDLSKEIHQEIPPEIPQEILPEITQQKLQYEGQSKEEKIVEGKKLISRGDNQTTNLEGCEEMLDKQKTSEQALETEKYLRNITKIISKRTRR